jgi:hypothetical protein
VKIVRVGEGSVRVGEGACATIWRSARTIVYDAGTMFSVGHLELAFNQRQKTTRVAFPALLATYLILG